MTKLAINDKVSLDLLRLVDSRLLIQANSGGGKSWLLRLIAEQAAGHVQVLILDPEGEFATLRERFDFLLVGSGGEIPCDPRSAALLARRLIELQASAVIDLYDLKLADRRRFVRLFLESLMHLPKELWHPVLIMLDEAHLFCPERSAGEAESASAVIDLMSQGRKRSYCGILATQRLSKLHKDAEAETNNVCIGRTWLDIDQKRAGALLGMNQAQAQGLRDLEAGEFFAFGPALSWNGVAQFRAAAVQTTHPKAGQRHKLSAPKPSEAVRRITADLKDLPQLAEAEIRDLGDARKKIAELERLLRDRPATDRVVKEEVRVEVPVLKNGQLDKANGLVERLEGVLAKVDEVTGGLREAIGRAAKPVQNIPNSSQLITKPSQSITKPARIIREPPVSIPPGDLSGPEQRILNGLAWLEAAGVTVATKVQVAFAAGYSPGGGAFGNPLGALRTRALIDYPSSGAVVLTDTGRALARSTDTPTTTAELHRMVLGRLDGPQKRILQPLLDAYPDELNRDELAAAAGYSPDGGAFGNPLGSLRSLGLIEYPGKGRIVALPVLFLEGK